jgi:hypothetical protein
VAVGAGVLTAAPALLTPFMAQPDNFGLYQPLVVGALWMTARGLKGDRRSFALAGLLAGGATLARNDGVLVLAVLGLAFAWDRWRSRHSAGARPPWIPVVSAATAVALFFVVMLPWYVRQLAVFGQLSPSTASGKVLFIRDIGEWNSISTPASPDHLLGMGVGPLLVSRVGGFISAVTIYAVLVGGVVLAPFMVIGGWVKRRQVDYGPFLTYAGILFAFSALVSASCAGRHVHPSARSRCRTAICIRASGPLGWSPSTAWDRAPAASSAARPPPGCLAAYGSFAFMPAGTASASGTRTSRACSRTPARRRDRLMSIDRELPVLDRARVVLSTTARCHRGRRPRVRHPLAHARARRRGAGRRADPRSR